MSHCACLALKPLNFRHVQMISEFGKILDDGPSSAATDVIAEPVRQRFSGALFGKKSTREILVVTSAYVCPYRLWGRGTRVSRQSDGGGEYHLFSAGNRAVLLGDRCFSWREIAGLPSLLKKRVFKSLACSAKRFSSIKLNFRT